MKRGKSAILGLAAVLFTLVGCASAPGASAGTGEARLSLRNGQVLDGAPCSVEEPGCPEGFTCASLDLETGRQSLCVNPQDICERLQCARGECVMLESFPVQIRCAP